MAATSALIWGLFAVLAATYGSIVGAGGGFLIVPALLLAGVATPEQAAGTSLVAVLANAASGSIAAAGQRRIDVRMGLVMAAASVPGALSGAYLTRWLSGPAFEVVFGGVLAAVGVWMVVGAGKTSSVRSPKQAPSPEQAPSAGLIGPALLGAGVGVLSSALGIGGGVIMVPVLITLLGVPPLVAAATSQLVLVPTALLGALSHAALGHVQLELAIVLAVGAVIGGQLGTRIAPRLRSSTTLVRLLSGALLLTGLRLVLRGLGL